MQRQKTMAKWLAVVLLLMVAVACYVILSTVLKKETSVKSTEATSKQEETTPQNLDPYADEKTPAKIPVYSVFPRRSEQIGNSLSAHVGGEEDETALALFTLADKTYLFFESNSQEYDVKEKGLHLATLQNDYLLSVTKIADDKETYLSSTLSKDGILIATRDENHTRLRLVSTHGEVVAKSEIERYGGLRFSIDKETKNPRAFATDGSFLYVYDIGDGLQAKRSNFVLYASGAKIETIVDFGGYQLILIDGDNGFEIIRFDKNGGFSRKTRLLNCSFGQLMPNVSNSAFTFALLLLRKDADGTAAFVCTCDKDGLVLNSYLANGVNDGVLKQAGDSILLISVDEKLTFCSHLELIAKESVSLDKSAFLSSANLEMKNLDEDLFLMTDGLTSKVYDLSFNLLFETKGKNLQFVRRMDGASVKLGFLFEAKSGGALTYSAFGGYDVYLVDVTI